MGRSRVKKFATVSSKRSIRNYSPEIHIELAGLK